MTHPLSGVETKISRAKIHFDTFLSAADSFLRGDAYTVERYSNEDSRKWVWISRNVKPVPEPINAIVGDCVHNLRSALDHLANALVRANGAFPTERTEFPIYWNRKSFPSPQDKKVSGIHPRALNKIKLLQPYNAGNERFAKAELLWLLHDLDNIDKHRQLVTTVATTKRGSLQEGTNKPKFSAFPNRALKEGTVFAQITFDRPQPELEYEPEFTPFISFDEAGPLKARTVQSIVSQMIWLVEDEIVPTFPEFFLPAFLP